VTRLGAQLFVFSIACDLVVQLVMLVKFLSRSQQTGKSVGELVHTLLFGFISKPYRKLLIAQNIEPTVKDELLHRVSIILLISLACGIVIMMLGFVLNR
jgi:hypothetical protein